MTLLDSLTLIGREDASAARWAPRRDAGDEGVARDECGGVVGGPPPSRRPRPAQRALGPEERLGADLRRARVASDVALLTPETDTRYVLAHRAAMRVAAVVLSVRPLRSRSDGAARGGSRPSVAAPRDVWPLLAEVAPELTGWAAHFAAVQPRRESVEQGARSRVTAREADDLARDASSFCTLVEAMVERLGPVSPPPSSDPVVGRAHR